MIYNLNSHDSPCQTQCQQDTGKTGHPRGNPRESWGFAVQDSIIYPCSSLRHQARRRSRFRSLPWFWSHGICQNRKAWETICVHASPCLPNRPHHVVWRTQGGLPCGMKDDQACRRKVFSHHRRDDRMKVFDHHDLGMKDARPCHRRVFSPHMRDDRMKVFAPRGHRTVFSRRGRGTKDDRACRRRVFSHHRRGGRRTAFDRRGRGTKDGHPCRRRVFSHHRRGGRLKVFGHRGTRDDRACHRVFSP